MRAAKDQTTSDVQERAREHETKIHARQVFGVNGGLGIWSDEESISARIDWQQRGRLLDLAMEGPLGLGTLQLQDNGQTTRLIRAGTVISQGDNAGIVLQRGLGLATPIPMSQFREWVRGLPGSGRDIRRDNEGKLFSLRFMDEQGTHWQVRFKRYIHWDGVEVPALISASGGPWSVRLVLKNWHYLTSRLVTEKRESNNRLPIPGR